MTLSGLSLLRLTILFIRDSVGCINSPYITYRKLVGNRSDTRSTLFIFLLVAIYFAFVSLIRVGRRSPFLLTIKFNILVASWVFGFLGMIILLYLFGKLIGAKSTLKSLFILWSYSLLPTLVWFFITSFMYIIFPPPRSESLPGKLYSLVFIAFSLSVLYWKLILYYLTLRFGLRIDLFRIAVVTTAITPFVLSYSIIMYRFGIFRIPFL